MYCNQRGASLPCPVNSLWDTRECVNVIKARIKPLSGVFDFVGNDPG